MVDEGGMEDDLGGHRGSVGPDTMWQILQDNEDDFLALWDARTDKEALMKKYGEIDTEFAHNLLGGGDEERDIFAAQSTWNTLKKEKKLAYIDAFEETPEFKEFILKHKDD